MQSMTQLRIIYLYGYAKLVWDVTKPTCVHFVCASLLRLLPNLLGNSKRNRVMTKTLQEKKGRKAINVVRNRILKTKGQISRLGNSSSEELP